MARLLDLIRIVVDDDGRVSRVRLVEAARVIGVLAVAADAIEPTINRGIIRLFEARCIDVCESRLQWIEPGLQAEIDSVVAMGNELYVRSQVRAGLPDEAAHHHRFALVARASQTGCWADARACREAFRTRYIELHPALRVRG